MTNENPTPDTEQEDRLATVGEVTYTHDMMSMYCAFKTGLAELNHTDEDGNKTPVEKFYADIEAEFPAFTQEINCDEHGEVMRTYWLGVSAGIGLAKAIGAIIGEAKGNPSDEPIDLNAIHGYLHGYTFMEIHDDLAEDLIKSANQVDANLN